MWRLIVTLKIAGAALVILFGLGVLSTLLKPISESMSPNASLAVALLSLALAFFMIFKIAKRILIRG